RAAGARLYRDLLAEALAALPPGIERLIVVPDGPVHRLPIETLRPGPDAAPLATRFDIVISPSATLWLGARQRGTCTVETDAGGDRGQDASRLAVANTAGRSRRTVPA